jgi:hypothetical protein
MIAHIEPAEGDHADFSADAWGVIGNSADRRFTFVRSDFPFTGRPPSIFIIDWKYNEELICGIYRGPFLSPV